VNSGEFIQTHDVVHHNDLGRNLGKTLAGFG
jgi:hypothetical protein